MSAASRPVRGPSFVKLSWRVIVYDGSNVEPEDWFRPRHMMIAEYDRVGGRVGHYRLVIADT